MTPKLQSALTHALMLAAGAVAVAYGVDLSPICPECPVCEEGEAVPEVEPAPEPTAPPDVVPSAPTPTE